MSRPFLDHRLSVAARLLAAVVGGYILTSQAIAVIALLLPLQPSESALAATMLSFAIYAAIILGAFAIGSIVRLWAFLIAAVALLAFVQWLHETVVWG